MKYKNGVEKKCSNCRYYEVCASNEVCEKYTITVQAYEARIVELQKELHVVQESERAEAQEADRLRAEVKELGKKLTETIKLLSERSRECGELEAYNEVLQRRVQEFSMEILDRTMKENKDVLERLKEAESEEKERLTMEEARNNIDVSGLKRLRDGIYRAFEGEMFGYPVCILVAKMLPESDRGDYYCGYVGVPPSHSLYQIGYMDNIMAQVDDDANVNGGLTFSNMADSWRTTKDKFKNYWFFGFDCAHYWNEEHPCSFENVKADCECLALALKNYRKD